jgi:lipopolysaccharide/colanic/teichoic acid biosynthesis glycosyltransferase
LDLSDRAYRVGGLLGRSSLDELPQLLDLKILRHTTGNVVRRDNL